MNQEQTERLMIENERLRQYVDHKAGCDRDKLWCDCGLSQILNGRLAAIEGAPK